MRILLAEQHPGDGAEVATRLSAAGHEVTRCHGPGAGTSWCPELSPDGSCPLAQDRVDVLVDVRTTPEAPTPGELGAVCALQHGTPLVVAGPRPPHGRGPWEAADACCSPDTVVEACRTATSIGSPTVHRAVNGAVRRALHHPGGGRPALVAMLTHGDGMDVFVTTDAPLPAGTAGQIRFAVRLSLAAYTPFWRRTRVTFLTSGFTWPAAPPTGPARPAVRP